MLLFNLLENWKKAKLFYRHKNIPIELSTS